MCNDIEREDIGVFHGWKIERLFSKLSQKVYFTAYKEAGKADFRETFWAPLYSSRELIFTWIEGRQDKAPSFDGQDLRPVR
jgi:hypothetical protein